VEKISSAIFAFTLATCTVPAYCVAVVGPAVAERMPEEMQEVATEIVNRVVISVCAMGWRVALVLCFWIGIRIEGAEAMRVNMGSTGKPCIIVANHTSFLDTVLLVAFMPLAKVGKVKMMASSHLLEMPCIGRIVSAMGHLDVPSESTEELMAERQQILEDHLRRGGIAGWFPEGKMNPGDTHKVQTFRADGMAMAVRVDVEVWCVAFVGNSRCWPRKAAVGGFPSRLGASIFRLCDSTHGLLEEAALPEGADDEQAKSTYLANRAQAEIKTKVFALVADGFNGNRSLTGTEAEEIREDKKDM